MFVFSCSSLVLQCNGTRLEVTELDVYISAKARSENGSIIYSLVEYSDDYRSFSINPANGTIYITECLDREIRSAYTVSANNAWNHRLCLLCVCVWGWGVVWGGGGIVFCCWFYFVLVFIWYRITINSKWKIFFFFFFNLWHTQTFVHCAQLCCHMTHKCLQIGSLLTVQCTCVPWYSGKKNQAFKFLWSK